MIERRSWVFGLVVAAFIASATPTASLAQSVPALERTAGACTSCAPDGWTISTPSPDVIVGNGPWPGGTWVVSDLAGGPREGSTLLMTLAGGSTREAVTATITGLTPGGSYELSVYYQGATLSSSAGTYVNGDFRVTVAGTTADFPTSSGDAWSEAVVPFTASGTTASVILSIRDLGTGTFGGFVAADDISVRSTIPDADGDGDPDATDCAPGDPTIFTGAPEVADDGVDQDCNGADTITCFVDADMDGFGTVAGTTTLAADGSCDTAEMESSESTDCDDMAAATFPGASETPDDGVDQDCSGADTITCFVDADMDGFGTDEGTTTLAADGSCDAEDMESSDSTDCDDTAATTFPGATDPPDDGVDQDCSGDDAVTCFVDADMDGFGTDEGTTTVADDGSCDVEDMESSDSTDCDDTSDTVFPSAPELPGDGVDQDCDGMDLPLDAGLAGDGGVAASDGGDGGSGTPGVSGGACSCRVGASSTPRTSLGWLLFAAALVAGRLRRRRASAR
ncbi:MAG: putative metal-binding motif-containing protein [Sandaracinaceae bacterium]